LSRARGLGSGAPRRPGFPATLLLTGCVILAIVGREARSDERSANDSLFAPIAAQLEDRLARLSRTASEGATPERLDLMMDAGRLDEAAAAIRSARGDPRDVARVHLRLALLRQDFATAKPLAEAILARRDAGDPERSLGYAWLFVIDDAARVDGRARGGRTPAPASDVPELLAEGRLEFSLLHYPAAESSFTRALEQAPSLRDSAFSRAARAAALHGLAGVLNQRRDYDRALAAEREALGLEAAPEALHDLSETLIRMGRTDEAIAAAKWALRLDPYDDTAHYLLGNGYARKTYTELFRVDASAFADSAGRARLAAADSSLTRGDRRAARAGYAALAAAHRGWADALVRLASLDFEEGRFASARDRCFAALRLCPDYGRAHATLAKALEFQRFEVDVHRADYERRFAAAPSPRIAGIDSFVVNWRALSDRDRKRVALSVEPWKAFLPVLLEGGSRFYIKPLYMRLSEVPGLETVRDTRISYDSRLWDDVRGAGGFTTVTGVEDVERTVFDRYNTVLHELTHQVHAVLTADQSRDIQELYRRAKERDDRTHEAYLSRYAGGSVYEYFAEGANALESPRRDRWDPREIVRERLDERDPDLRELVRRTLATTDLAPYYPIAYTNAGFDRIEKGDLEGALRFIDRALARSPREEKALEARTQALTLRGERDAMVVAARRALEAHPQSGSVAATAADAWWYGGRSLDSAIAVLRRARSRVRAKDRYRVDVRLGDLYWTSGDAARAIAAYDSALAYQSDLPEALWGKAAALALERRWPSAFEMYGRAVRGRTGIARLRCDYARDLIRAGRRREARTQLDEAGLLDPQNPTAEALRAWLALDEGQADSARARALRALAWGSWCDLARLVEGRAAARLGRAEEAREAGRTGRERIARHAPPEFFYRASLASWESVHELPAVERELLGPADPARVGPTRSPSRRALRRDAGTDR